MNPWVGWVGSGVQITQFTLSIYTPLRVTVFNDLGDADFAFIELKTTVMGSWFLEGLTQADPGGSSHNTLKTPWV